MIPLPSPAAVVERSNEWIVHFRCADATCAQWWSISDFDTPPGRWGTHDIHCPRCGKLHRLDANDALSGVLAA